MTMPHITDEHTFADRSVEPPVEVCTSRTQNGETFYLLKVDGTWVDHELTEEEARGLQAALERAIQFQNGTGQ